MSAHVENLAIGDYITLVECHRDQQSVLGTPEGVVPLWLDADDVKFGGQPLLIRAISLPFICVEYLGQRLAIDVRDWGVQPVNKRYAREMLARPTARDAQSCRRPEKGNCPQCGERLRQRMIQGQRGFRLVCPQCDWDGGEVQTQGLQV